MSVIANSTIREAIPNFTPDHVILAIPGRRDAIMQPG